MSNRDRLEDAGIVDRNRSLSDEQYDAIESLSEEEVDQLISVNRKLVAETTDRDPIIVIPGAGINQTDRIED